MFLADVVDVDRRNILNQVQQLVFPLLTQLQFQIDIGVEMVFNGPLAMAGDDEYFFDAALQGFFDDILDDRLVDNGDHFLGDGLGDWQKACPIACRRDDGLTNLFLHDILPFLPQPEHWQ